MCFPVKLGVKLLAFAAIYLAVEDLDSIYKSFSTSTTYGIVFSVIQFFAYYAYLQYAKYLYEDN